jgi:hypothetical protein
VALGATISDERWYVRAYNVDDTGNAYVNGRPHIGSTSSFALLRIREEKTA